MLYRLLIDLPGLRKGAVFQLDKPSGMYYAPKDNYIDFIYFPKQEVENSENFKLI